MDDLQFAIAAALALLLIVAILGPFVHNNE